MDWQNEYFRMQLGPRTDDWDTQCTSEALRVNPGSPEHTAIVALEAAKTNTVKTGEELRAALLAMGVASAALATTFNPPSSAIDEVDKELSAVYRNEAAAEAAVEAARTYVQLDTPEWVHLQQTVDSLNAAWRSLRQAQVAEAEALFELQKRLNDFNLSWYVPHPNEKVTKAKCRLAEFKPETMVDALEQHLVSMRMARSKTIDERRPPDVRAARAWYRRRISG